MPTSSPTCPITSSFSFRRSYCSISMATSQGSEHNISTLILSCSPTTPYETVMHQQVPDHLDCRDRKLSNSIMCPLQSLPHQMLRMAWIHRKCPRNCSLERLHLQLHIQWRSRSNHSGSGLFSNARHQENSLVSILIHWDKKLIRFMTDGSKVFHLANFYILEHTRSFWDFVWNKTSW